MVAFGEMASLMNAQLSGTDELDLARWTVMGFRGLDGHNNKILWAYIPCKNNRDNSGTSYQQNRWYFIQKEKKEDEPRWHFLADLKQLLEQWKDKGSRLVVCLDANKDVCNGVIGWTLTETDVIDMVEAVHPGTGKKLRATHFWGLCPINAIWTTRDVEVANACAMPIGYGACDHRMLVVNLVKESLVGPQPQAIVHPGACRLNSKIPQCLQNYNAILNHLIVWHHLKEKLQDCFNPRL